MGKTITTGWLSAVINGIKIKSDLRCNPDNYSSRSSRDASYVTMHYTGNNKDTARANANYFGGAGRNASAHLFVDDTEIYQSVPLNSVAWHCGAQTYKHAYCRNANSIGIEMCCTAGNYKISKRLNRTPHICARISVKCLASVQAKLTSMYSVTGMLQERIARHRWQEVTMLNG